MLPRFPRPALLGLLLAGAALTAPALANRGPDPFLVGARAMGMGGAVVASTHDVNGQYHNPAVFGFTGRHISNYPEHTRTDMLGHGRTDFTNNAYAGARYRLAGGFGTYLGDMSEFDSGIFDNGITNQDEAATFLRMANALGGIDGKGVGGVVDAAAGAAFHWRHTAQGPRGYFQGVGYVGDVDTANGLGFSDCMDCGPGSVSDQIDTSVSGDGSVKVLTGDQQTTLSNAGFNAAAIADIDFLIRQEGISSGEVDQAVQILDAVGTNTTGGSTDLNNNTTNVVMRGFTLASYPLSFGYAWDRPFPGSTWFGEGSSWALGGNIVPMQGTVYANQFFIFDADSGDFASKTVENGERTNTIGYDLGIMGRYEGWQVGVVGRNLNTPTFTGPTVDGTKYPNVKLEPQVRGGVAWFPVRSVTLEADLDLVPNDTLLPDYNTQYAALGFEWRGARDTDIRLGAYENLLSDTIGRVYTFGVGMGFLGGRLDLAAALSEGRQEYQGAELKLLQWRLMKDEVPCEMSIQLDFSVKF